MAQQRNIPGIVYVKDGVNLCQFGGFACFGCCGYSFRGKDLAVSSLFKQSAEFKASSDSRAAKIGFRDRAAPEKLNACNFCQNLVLKSDYSREDMIKDRYIRTYCPFHPALNDGEDLREGHCEHNFMCSTQIYFHGLKDDSKQLFAVWLKARIENPDIDWYTYSVNMDTSVFLKEFLKHVKDNNIRLHHV
jgi:hypothetical protein